MSEKDKESSPGGPGKHFIAPLGYIEVAGSREALQKAAQEITKLRKENELLKRELEKRKAGGKESWDYSHLGEDEKTVVDAYLSGEFSRASVEEVCKTLEKEHGRKEGTFGEIYRRLKDYGTLELVGNAPI